jgi:hypothetical protein
MDKKVLEEFLSRNANSSIKILTTEGQIRTVIKIVSLDDDSFTFYDAKGAAVALPLKKIEEIWYDWVRR